MGSGFPIDLVLFGMIAAFLVLRLRSILGRRTGYEPPARAPGAPSLRTGPMIDGVAEATPAAPARPLPDPASVLGQMLARMQQVGHDFDPAHFLDGAERAFRLVVGAFAAGDRVALRSLLTDDTYRAFEGAIAAREAAEQTQKTAIRAIPTVAITDAALAGTRADITVRFVSDQVSMTVAADGAPVSGTDAVTEIVDIWVFERDLASNNPAWLLAGATSS